MAPPSDVSLPPEMAHAPGDAKSSQTSAMSGALIPSKAGSTPAASIPEAARQVDARGDERRLRGRLNRAMGRAMSDFGMLEEGDRVMCCVSGGKDSYVLHDLLVDLQKRAPIKFDVVAVNVDQGHPGYPREVLIDYMRVGDHAFRMISEDTYSIVKAKIPAGKTTCSLCSRLRRGILYTAAREMKCNKIALGHHRDDIITTLMLNLFFQGTMKAMPPKLTNDRGDVVVLRPLAYCAEDDIRRYAEMRSYPLIPCTLCGSQPSQQRAIISDMLATIDRQHPGVRDSMIAALGNVRPSHLLDRALNAQLATAQLASAQPGSMPPPFSGQEPPLEGQEDRSMGRDFVPLSRLRTDVG